MERVTITIETQNAAFDDAPAYEIARILRDLAERFERDEIPPRILFDANGNAAGSVAVE
jgi:hypothetical protein